MEITLDYLKKLASDGYITDTALIHECEKNPEMMKNLNLSEFVSQIQAMDIEKVAVKEEVKPAVIEPAVIEPAVIEDELGQTETDSETEQEIVVEEKVDEKASNKKNKKS